MKRGGLVTNLSDLHLRELFLEKILLYGGTQK